MNSPRMVGAQYGDQWRNNSRKNEEVEPKQKQHPVVDVMGDGSKVRCCKNNTTQEPGMSDFIFGGSKIPADGDCSHEIKRRLLLGRKVMTNLDSIFKTRDITLPTKVRLVKAMVFPVVTYGGESWTLKKAKR